MSISEILKLKEVRSWMNRHRLMTFWVVFTIFAVVSTYFVEKCRCRGDANQFALWLIAIGGIIAVVQFCSGSCTDSSTPPRPKLSSKPPPSKPPSNTKPKIVSPPINRDESNDGAQKAQPGRTDIEATVVTAPRLPLQPSQYDPNTAELEIGDRFPDLVFDPKLFECKQPLTGRTIFNLSITNGGRRAVKFDFRSHPDTLFSLTKPNGTVLKESEKCIKAGARMQLKLVVNSIDEKYLGGFVRFYFEEETFEGDMVDTLNNAVNVNFFFKE